MKLLKNTLAVCSCIQSNLVDNYHYLSYKYNIACQAPLCKLLNCFDICYAISAEDAVLINR